LPESGRRSAAAGSTGTTLTRWLAIEPHEGPAVVAGFGLFFALFAGYYMLRPVRETLGIAGGVEHLQWLFTATFVATLLALPAFGWVAGRVPRRLILPAVYGFFTLNLAGFAFALARAPDAVWLARGFYVWLSVFNLVAVSLAWSVLVDCFDRAQAQRVFGLAAAGASVGGLVGPLMAVGLVGSFGHPGLLALAAVALCAAIAMAAQVRRLGRRADGAAARPLGGNPLAGVRDVVRSPYLGGIALFMILLASVSTFLYVEQARLVEQHFPTRAAQTRIFGSMDAVVQVLSVLLQVFVTGRVAQRLGLGVLLVGVPLLVMCGFLWLAVAPGFAVLAIVMIVRRAGEYGLIRPGREMLYGVVSDDAKYRAKNFNDTAVYRGADAVSGWLKAGLDALGQHVALAMLAGATLAAAWAACGAWLAGRHRDGASSIS